MTLSKPGRLGVDSPDFSGQNYPFVLPAKPREYIEDLQISARIPSDKPIHLLKTLGLLSATPNLTFGYGDGTVLIDTTGATRRSWNWDADTRIIQWSGSKWVVQIVVVLGKVNGPTTFTNAVIDDRAITFLNEPVLDLQVWNETTNVFDAIVASGYSTIKPGYNVALVPEVAVQDTGLQTSDVTINIVPGQGAGRHPACEVNSGVTAIGTARPTEAGDLLVSGKDCIVFKPLVTFSPLGAYVEPGKFQVVDNCEARCTIDDFEAAATYITRQWNRFVALAKRADELRDKYHAIIQQYADWYVCALSNPVTGTVIAAQPCAAAVIVNVLNPHCTTLRNAMLTITVDDTDGNTLGSLAEDGVYTTIWDGDVSYAKLTEIVTSSNNEYLVNLNDIPGGQVSTTFLRISLPDGSCYSSGKAKILLGGSMNLNFINLQTVEVDFDLNPVQN